MLTNKLSYLDKLLVKEGSNMTKFLSLLTGLAFVFVGQTAIAQDDTAELSKTYLERSEVEKIVKDYLLENGDIVIQAIEEYQVRQEQEANQAAVEAIKTSEDYLYSGKSPDVGPDDASVTIVEFFDYNCGYCKKALDDIVDLLNEDDDLKVVFKEVPILSPTSREAAKWAIAADKQGKYFEYHRALMQHRGQYTDSVLAKIAKDEGLDVDQMKADKDSAEVEQMIDNNLANMEKFGIRGTPSFIIGDQILKGFVGKDALKQIISDMRAKES